MVKRELKHTSLPWTAERKDEGRVVIDLPGDGAIEILGYNTEANAALIVRAVKVHQLLVHLAELVVHNTDFRWEGTKSANDLSWITVSITVGAIRQARAALALVEEEA